MNDTGGFSIGGNKPDTPSSGGLSVGGSGSTNSGTGGGPSLGGFAGPDGYIDTSGYTSLSAPGPTGILGEDPNRPFGFDPQQVAVNGRDVTVYVRPSGSTAYVAGDASYQVQNMSEKELVKIQQVLAGAGLLSGSVRFGMPDSRTIDAYEQILGLSNRLDVSPMVVLGRLGSSNRDMMLEQMRQAAASQSSGPTRAPFTAQVSNPVELRQAFQSALVEMTGGGDSGIDVDAMVEAYQATQRNAQAKAYNVAPRGGTVESAPSPQSFAVSQIEEAAPVQVQANSAVERAGDLLGMLGKFGGA